MVMEQHMSAGCSKGFRKTNNDREKHFEDSCHIIVINRLMFSRNHYSIHTAGRRLIQDVNRQNADRRHLLGVGEDDVADCRTAHGHTSRLVNLLNNPKWMLATGPAPN
jgi:hypothetical protein